MDLLHMNLLNFSNIVILLIFCYFSFLQIVHHYYKFFYLKHSIITSFMTLKIANLIVNFIIHYNF